MITKGTTKISFRACSIHVCIGYILTKTEKEVIEHPSERLPTTQYTHTHGAREVRFRLALFPVSQSAPIVLHNDRRYRWLWPIVTAVINRCVFIAKAGSAAEHTVAM